MKTAPKTGQKLLLLVGENEWSAVGYFDKKLGWVAERNIPGRKAAVVRVDPVGWDPIKSAA